MPFFTRTRRKTSKSTSRGRSKTDINITAPATPNTPRIPLSSQPRSFLRSNLDLSNPDVPLYGFSDQVKPTIKGDILGQALHLARLAVILDKAEVHAGATRAYYDCCFLLSSAEPHLGEVELEIARQISKEYKRRVGHLSTVVSVSPLSPIPLQLGAVPAAEFNLDLPKGRYQKTQLLELNSICQFLHTISHCCEIIYRADAERYGLNLRSQKGEELISLSGEFEKLRHDIIRFRDCRTEDYLSVGGADTLLFVLLGSFKSKVSSLIKRLGLKAIMRYPFRKLLDLTAVINSENKEMMEFLVNLFDLQLPAEYEAKAKPLPIQPLAIRKNYGRHKSPSQPLTPGPILKYATARPEEERKKIRLDPAPNPKRLSKCDKPSLPNIKASTCSRNGKNDDEKVTALARKGTFLID